MVHVEPTTTHVGFQGKEQESDEEGDDPTDELWKWRQLVIQRVNENLSQLEIFVSGRYEYLEVLNLQCNDLQDISPLATIAKTLRVLNVSQNAIVQLPNGEFWGKFKKLSLCFLSRNGISAWKDMEGLQACASTLLWLTLDGNPFMALRNARKFLVNKLPFLIALNEYVVTDEEFMKHSRPSHRFRARSQSLHIAAFHMPIEFEDDRSALRYANETLVRMRQIYADNSPTITTQRVVRGFLSRRHKFPRLQRVRELITHVQKHIRGFLFRQLIKRQFITYVQEQGQEHLLQLNPSESILFSAAARRGLKSLIVYVQHWKMHFHEKKQAIAIKKIRFWCQMMHRRYLYKRKQLLSEGQEVFIYYTRELEDYLMDLANKAAHRDPYLMTLTPDGRESFLRQRCTRSGASVLRPPSEETVRLVSAKQTTQDKTKPVTATMMNVSSAIVRVFPRDLGLENQVLVTEKHFLHQDLELIAAIQKQSTKADRIAYSQRQTKLSRAVVVSLTQLQGEIEKRLVMCNKKIVNACIKLQELKNRPPLRFSLSRVDLRPRGHSLSRWERKKFNALFLVKNKHSRYQYPMMNVFIPWSIDMYLHILASIDRASTQNGLNVFAFALSYDQMRRLNASICIQSAWRACFRQSKRNNIEVAIARALVCIQRWWRFQTGLRRRLTMLRQSLLLCASINTRTLFMEEKIYQAVVDASSWQAIQALNSRASRERTLHCRMVNGQVEIALPPGQLLLRNASKRSQSILRSSSHHLGYSSKLESWSHQRCSSYLPVWLPETPEHCENSMSTRDEDATPLLLVERVDAEPTLMERELLLGVSQHTVEAAFADKNPYHQYSMGQRVSDTAAHVMELARRLLPYANKAWRLQAPIFQLESTSFVRLQFESVEEARKRALVLLWKTYNPVAKSFVRLYSIETMIGAALRHHQWALSQVATDEEIHRMLEGCQLWLHADFPAQWLQEIERKLGVISSVSKSSIEPSKLCADEISCRRDVPTCYRHGHFTTHPRLLSPPTTPLPPNKPAPLHVITSVDSEDTRSSGVYPAVRPRPPPPGVSPASTSSPSSGGWNRHQLLTDRLGKPKYDSLDMLEYEDRVEREYHVRDLREERERAMEAMIVDRRMIQREKAAEVAGIKLDIDVKLQKLRYEREFDKLSSREIIEQEKMLAKTSKLTREFEKSFTAQTGAMMRLAARESVARQQLKRKEYQKDQTSAIRIREAESLKRRQIAKSYVFVNNQKVKQELTEIRQNGSTTAQKNTGNRLKKIRQRIQDDKEIKQMLRLM